VVNGDDPNIRSLGAMPWTNVVSVGVGEANDVRISAFSESPEGSSFALAWKGSPWASIRWSLPGLYNARNAAMAGAAAALALGPLAPWSMPLAALSRFRGVKRRQEVVLAREGMTVIEDFGHHPTALAETLKSFRNRFPGAVISAAFEPRSNTARTKVMEGAFLEALALADDVYLGPVNRADKLAASERFDAPGVAETLRARGLTAEAFSDNQALLSALTARTVGRNNKPRVVVFFTNGSFDGIISGFTAKAG
jgi:UDP-N-acetylmuramate: L-alanyl-gamma-D-glutamyl-meso-diaminopimelate ligase